MIKNFQGMSSVQGALFVENSLQALRLAGWQIIDTKKKIESVGIEVDIVAENRHDITFFFECKGSLQGDRPGSKRTDTLKKAIASGYLFSLSDEFQCTAPLILLTSHLPEKGSGIGMLSRLPRTVFFDVLNPWNHGKRLAWIANADDVDLELDMDELSLINLIKKQWKMCCD